MKKNSKKILISVAVAASLAACGIGGYYAASKPKEQKKEVVLEEGERVLDGTVEFSVYNEETGTQYFYEFNADEINFNGAKSFVNAAGQTCYENNFDFGVDVSKLAPSLVKTQVDSSGHKETTYTVGFFQNKELLNSVVDETRLTEKAGVQDFYKVIESKNGHGGTTVLNEKHIKSSFFEIVFDIVKSESDPEGTDYNFSLVLSDSVRRPGIC